MKSLACLEAVVLVLLAQLGAREGQVGELVARHGVHAPGVLQRLRRGQPPRRLHVQQVPDEVLRSAEASSRQASQACCLHVRYATVHDAPGMLQRLRRGPRWLHVQQVPYEVLRSAEARLS